MTKVPFTLAGAVTKIQGLYALSDAALLVQAELIRSGFQTWINHNFVLDASQQTYLAQVDSLFVSYVGQQLGMAVQHRLPVSLAVPVSRADTRRPISKLISCRVNLFSVEYSPDAGTTASGNLSFTVAYKQ